MVTAELDSPEGESKERSLCGLSDRLLPQMPSAPVLIVAVLWWLLITWWLLALAGEVS